VPFLPFTKYECAAMTHKFLLRFASNIRQPIDFRPAVNRLIGHCRLSLVEDGKICTIMTENFYNEDLGAQSLANAVKDVEHDFTEEYNQLDEEITEDTNSGPLQCFTVRCMKVADDKYEIGVFGDAADDATVKEGEEEEKEWQDITW
jgi:hypothetical protein